MMERLRNVLLAKYDKIYKISTRIFHIDFLSAATSGFYLHKKLLAKYQKCKSGVLRRSSK